MAIQNILKIDSSNQELICLCDSFIAPVTLEGKIFQTMTHFFQSKKFDPKLMVDYQKMPMQLSEYIRIQSSARLALQEGRRQDFPIRPDWKKVKDGIMYAGRLAKVEQHPKILKVLLDTGDATLFDSSAESSYWNVSPEKLGLNRSGTLWMLVRDEKRRLMNFSW